jgi:peptide/nickel transport system substrate-binding protein
MTIPRLTKRQALLGAGAGVLASLAPRRAAAAEAGPLTVVLESEAVILDPHATTAAITRTFGYHVFDTLFSMDSKGVKQPQMVDSHSVSPDGLHWSFTLRQGLAFHDGAPVTAADCVASLKRWGPKDSLGRMMGQVLVDIVATDARSFRIDLKEPFPLMLDVLGKPNAPVPFIMPERIIKATGDKRISEIIGSGPFKFVASEWRPGNQMILARNEAYVPRREPPDFLAGGKVVKVPELVMKVMPDDSTGVTALIAGEIDYMQYLPFDWVAKLDKTPGITLMTLSGIDMFQGNFRLNHASGPFADPAVRRVLWHLVDQHETLQAIGIPDRFALKDCDSFWMCDAPLSTDAGAGLAKFSIAEAKAALAKTSYKGEPVVIMEVAHSISQTAGNVLAQHMKEAGFTVDEQQTDWGTVLARRAKKDGWSLFPVYSNGIDMISPLSHFYITNTCADYPGWSCDAEIPKLLTAFAAAADEAQRRDIAAKIQVAAYQLVPSVMWGQFSRPAGYRNRLKNLIQSSFPMFWEVELVGA